MRFRSKESFAMSSNRLAFAALGLACIAAAAGGGYLASRQNAVPAPVVASSAPAPAAALTPERPVQETEAVVGDTTSKPIATPAPAQTQTPAASGRTPAASKRADAAPRASTRDSRPASSTA